MAQQTGPRKKKSSHQERRRARQVEEARLDRQRVRSRIMAVLAARGPDATVTPTQIAQDLDPDGWRRYLRLVREEAADLARKDRIEILRRGKWVDPDDVRGVVRLRLVPPGLFDEEE